MPSCPACYQHGATATQLGWRCDMCGHERPFEDCCEPDYDYERGQYVHTEGCTRHEGEEE